MSEPPKFKGKPKAAMDYETADEANNLLSNGILVETSKGLVCMSLNDALSSDLNLSVEDLQNVAAQLILQQNVVPKKDRGFVQPNFNSDSDGFSSECSDVSTTTASSVQSAFITLSSLTSEIQSNIFNSDSQLQNFINIPKIVSIGSLAVDRKPVNAEIVGTPPKPNEIIEIAPATTEPTISIIPVTELTTEVKNPIEKKKGRGGWPKGRKRKPELLNLPPKAPATGYNLYLNEQRKLFKDTSLPFHEITKIIGNKWSSLSLDEKKPYLGKAEEDKKRYREELKQYRQSDAYRAYLAKKRKKRMQNNVLSESDMDATDEIDEEDNEELYCRTCDQWFHNLHNKREHLQGKQHLKSVSGDINRELGSDMEGFASTVSFSTSLDESSLDAIPNSSTNPATKNGSSSVIEAMSKLVALVTRRDAEIRALEKKKEESLTKQQLLHRELTQLNEQHNRMKKSLQVMKDNEKDMENRVFRLWQVPSFFIITDFNNADAAVNLLFEDLEN